ncbi:Homeobox domain [Macleaya cordata]|uniref:Homeobox domain n=1 Tax=Macleaya cordata TaxID=56857 RepID=A0A200R7P2_MACCD|nr:Homeobox domain [Macleaya cordata]
MELRGQDKRSIGGLMPSSSSVYNNPSLREPSFSTTSVISSPSGGGGGERRRDGTGNNNNNNGATTLNPTQTLDHHHHHHHRQQPVREPVDPPDPDPVPVSIAVVGAPSSPVAGGSTTPRTTSNVIKSTSTVRYRECLKNHAASIGGHVVDGCGEFMPSGEEGTRESLKCAACDCHRNFHRKEVDGEPQSGPNCYYCYNPNKADRGSRVPPPLTAPPTLIPAPLQQHQNKFQFGLPPTSPPSGPIQPMMMAFGGGGGGATESSSEELNVFHSSGHGMGQPPPPSFGSSKKRFRTKFSQEQKEKMLEFAEKIGWRIQKQDEAEVQQFCAEVGVKRQVLKVWMHNNKHAMKKKEL